MKAKLLVMGVLCAVGNAFAQAPVISAEGPTAFCQGGSVTLKSTSGAGYQWYKNNIAIGGATSQEYIASTGGSYYVRYTGSKMNSNTIGVTVYAKPKAATTPAGNVTVCQGNAIKISSSPAGTGGSYLWSTNATTASISVSTAGSYYVTVTNANGCSSTSPAVNVTVAPLPSTPTITAMGKLTFCSPGSVELRSSAATGNRWYRNGVVISGATGQSYFATASGSYTVRVYNGSCWSAPSTAKTVTVKLPPVASVSPSGPIALCPGGSALLTASSAGTGGSYLWSNGEVKKSITVNQTGSYSVTLTGSNGCSATSSQVNVTVGPEKPVITSNTGSFTFCEGGSIILSAPAADEYMWSTGESSSSITVSQAGQYSVRVWDANGCTNVSETIEVSVNPNPTVDAGSDQQIFIGYGNQTAELDASVIGSPQFSFVWSNGDTTQSTTVSPTSTTTYTVTVTDGYGCMDSDSVTVNVTDIRCGQNNNMVLLCHETNEELIETICVDSTAVQMHLDHGDYLGNCVSSLRKASRSANHFAEHVSISPNPFSSTATLSYEVDAEAQVVIEVFDVLGQRICTLLNETLRKGNYTTIIDGDRLNSADEMFFLRITCGEHSVTNRFVRANNR